MKKLLGVLLILIIALVVIVAVGKNIIAKTIVERGVYKVTGLPLKMESLKLGLLGKTYVSVKELKLYNPKGYQDKVMCDLPEFYVQADLPSIFKGKVHLQEVILNMEEFVVVKNAQGELNINALKPVKEDQEAKEDATEGKEPKEKGKAPEVQIDLLKFRVAKVTYKDYSKGSTPVVKEFKVNIDEQFENVTDIKALVKQLLQQSLMNTAIGNLAGFDLSSLGGSDLTKLPSGSLEKITETAKEAAEMMKEKVKDFELPFGKK